jgi:predicted GIY-YIG superfamily endonuclease
VSAVDIPTCVYRFFDRAGRLLYIGITVNPPARFAAHAVDKPWWPEVDHSRTRLVWFDTRPEAERQEMISVRNERPLHNIVTGDVDGRPTFIKDPARSWGRPATVLTPHQEQQLQAAVEAGERADEADRKLWEVVEAARGAGVPDVLLCERTGVSRATLNRRLGPRKSRAA